MNSEQEWLNYVSKVRAEYVSQIAERDNRIKELEVLLLQETAKCMKYQHALQHVSNGSMPYDVHDAYDEMRRTAYEALNIKKP